MVYFPLFRACTFEDTFAEMVSLMEMSPANSLFLLWRLEWAFASFEYVRRSQPDSPLNFGLNQPKDTRVVLMDDGFCNALMESICDRNMFQLILSEQVVREYHACRRLFHKFLILRYGVS
jgi:hypothetical protein